jgi:hypothetical protein
LLWISGVSSVSLPNDTFTSTYNSYCFTFNCTGSTGLNVLARLRAGGVDNSSTNYQRVEWANIPITAVLVTGETSWNIGRLSGSTGIGIIQDFILIAPKVARHTSGLSFLVSDLDTNIFPIQRFHGVNVTTSYDSMTFLTSTGNMTGSISCYGFNQ